MSDLAHLNIQEARALLSRGDISAVELTQAVLDQIVAPSAALPTAELAGREIPHVAHRGLDAVFPAEEFVDGFRLGRRFDDDQFSGQVILLSIES